MPPKKHHTINKPSDYMKRGLIEEAEPYLIPGFGNLKTCILNPCVLYRAGRFNEFMYLSDKESIAPYINSGRAQHKYTVETPLRLFVFNTENIRLFVNFLHTEGSVDVRGYMDENNVIWPALPVSQMDPNERPIYMNRVIAEALCDSGLDGWIALPDNDIRQKNMNMKKYIETGEIEFEMNPYAPEVMICNPNVNNYESLSNRSTRRRR